MAAKALREQEAKAKQAERAAKGEAPEESKDQPETAEEEPKAEERFVDWDIDKQVGNSVLLRLDVKSKITQT